MSLPSQFFIDTCTFRSLSLERRREERVQEASSEQFGTVDFIDSWMASFRIPARTLIRYMGHVLYKCSFTPFSKRVNELKPFEHCVLLRQILNSPGVKRCKLSVQQDKDVTLFRSSQDFHAGSIAREARLRRSLTPSRNILQTYPFSTRLRRKQRSASRPLDSLLSIYTPPSLTFLKYTRGQHPSYRLYTPTQLGARGKGGQRRKLKRAVEFHEMFYQAAGFLSKLQEGTTPHEQGSIPLTSKNFASYFSLCSSSFEKEVV